MNNVAKKVFFGNYKGGVGKTTSTYQIALELKEKGEKVLLIDLDPQSSLSEICLMAYNKNLLLSELPDNETLNCIYMSYLQANKNNIKFTLNTSSLIKRVNEIDFIPNSLFSLYGGLDKISMDMDMDMSIKNLLILKNFIEDNDIEGKNLNNKYNFIFFDCPPSNNTITQMAFLYSDYYIIPSVMNALSTRGVKHYINIINEIYNSYCKYNENAALFSMLFGHEPKLIGIFETMLKGTTDSDKHRNSFEKKYLFETVIKHRKDIAENTSDGHSVDKHEDYKKLTEEMLERIKQLDTDV